MKSSCGSDTRHSCRTVSPPTPESNIATGSCRSAAATRVMFAGAAAASGRSELHLAHRLLDLAEDHVAELLALIGLEALHRRDHSGHDQRHEQDQCDVLHGSLAAL